MLKTEKPICVAPTGDWCGEGAVWHPGHAAVYWTDINRFLMHRYTPADGAVKTWFFDEPVTSAILTTDEDTLLVVLGSRVIYWKPGTDERRDQGFKLDAWPHVRFNDARADPRGSLFIGSMRNNVNPDGSPGEVGGKDGQLWRVDPDGAVTLLKSGMVISNTDAWNPERTRFYTADTPPNELFVFDYDAATGAIANERPFLFGFERGHPDGSTVDAEGYLWNCRYGGRCLVRVAPSGQIDQIVEMPVSNLTMCTFGGPELSTLYVTSAGLKAPDGERFAGGLFRIQTNVKGQPENRFRISA